MTDRLSATELVNVNEQAGFSPNNAAIMAAIELAESGGAYGNTTDLNKALSGGLSPGSYPALAWFPSGSRYGGPEESVGPAQVNILAHPDADPRKLMSSPLYSGVESYKISAKGTNFRAWSTFTSGAYKKFLPATQAAAAGNPTPAAPAPSETPSQPSTTPAGTLPFPFPPVPIPDLGSVLGGITGSLGSSVAKDFAKLLGPIATALTRAGLVALGALFILVALVVLAHAGGADFSSMSSSSPPSSGSTTSPSSSSSTKATTSAKAEEAAEVGA